MTLMVCESKLWFGNLSAMEPGVFMALQMMSFIKDKQLHALSEQLFIHSLLLIETTKGDCLFESLIDFGRHSANEFIDRIRRSI